MYTMRGRLKTIIKRSLHQSSIKPSAGVAKTDLIHTYGDSSAPHFGKPLASSSHFATCSSSLNNPCSPLSER